MKQSEIFGSAKWIAASVDALSGGMIIRKNFPLSGGERAKLYVIGLGTFVCYMNGKRVGNDLFLPLNSEYEKSSYPVGEELTGYNIYASEFDVTEHLAVGKNTLALHIGSGWYDDTSVWGVIKSMGEKKAIFRICITNQGGEEYDILSDGEERWAPSYVKKSHLHTGESHDYTEWCDCCLNADFDDSEWTRVKLSKPVESEYAFSGCPTDKEQATFIPTVAYKCPEYTVYDVGKNLTGYPVFVSAPGVCERITVTFSEAMNAKGTDLNDKHIFDQVLTFTTDGTDREIFPQFTWYAFRYFRVDSDLAPKCVKLVHADVPVDSYFHSDSATLNWLWETYVHTQLVNMHRGNPSDCPHIERFGYTGDGQLCARSSIMSLGGREFYEKWMRDIAGCQDKLTGRIQYTSPYFYCGGGPGGWGIAIITVPYEFYKFYGDKKPLEDYYPQMLAFIKFLEDHSEAGLVTSYKDGVWCLGDWCPPEKWTLPTPFVNTYFHVVALTRLIEIARAIGREEDIPKFEEKIVGLKGAINKFYFNDFDRDDCYCANAQGANGFAIDIDLGTQNTRDKFVSHYNEIGYYDTGIFGTEIVTRKLFDLGEGDLAFRLMTASRPHGFGKWRELGFTTLLEYWNEPCRSYNHPMFGAATACLYEYVLGIRHDGLDAGYNSVIISPAEISDLRSAEGYITTPNGRLGVSYTSNGTKKTYTVTIPRDTTAKISIPGIPESTVSEGTYTFTK